ncbi:FecR domain-containing protein [Bordetella genomosp. 13]|uniref:FecR domain-containing protein n=1 Tax=Bordetella genomosp. 13 TaxID=463040 RepID=UPI0021B589AA|nr:FecR domain-containing protein [Bordetella genomosp. 13]
MPAASCTPSTNPPAAPRDASRPMAGGQPIREATADAAAEWLTVMLSGEATDDDHARWQQWRAADPEHERAWQHIEAVMAGRLGVLQRHAAYQALSPYAGPAARGRRQALRLLAWGGVLGGTALLASHTQTWHRIAADYRTGTGEQRGIALADGTRILLNTASAIDVRFDSHTRLVALLAGEAMIATGHAPIDGVPDPRPFIVQTGEGRVRALGTRFAVRQDDGRTLVAVAESAVEIAPAAAQDQTRLLRAGERTAFTRLAVDMPSALAEYDLAWTRSQIVAEDARLADFLTDLARYRPGLLRCDPAVADLRVSGVFPLDDTDRVLAMLPKVLPVQVRQRTRHWVTVEGRG